MKNLPLFNFAALFPALGDPLTILWEGGGTGSGFEYGSSEHEAALLPGLGLRAADDLPVGDHVERDGELLEHGHHVPVVLRAALHVRRAPRLLHLKLERERDAGSAKLGLKHMLAFSWPEGVNHNTVGQGDRTRNHRWCKICYICAFKSV